MEKSLDNLKIAIVCDSLDQYGGAEKIVDVLHEIFPNAPIYTSFYNKEKMVKHGFRDSDKTIITPVFGKNRLLLRIAKQIFFLYPIIFESFDFNSFDLVISSSSRFAHGIVTTTDTKHISYIHSPNRFVWDYFTYMHSLKLPFFLKIPYPFFISYIRLWDRNAADRVDRFIANSHYTKNRVLKFYRRDSHVILPSVDTNRFVNEDRHQEGKYFLWLGRFARWKKPEFVIECFNKLGYSLRFVGNGEPTYIAQLRKSAHANISFFENQTDDEVVNHIRNAKALIWSSVEDFGITPVEAQAAGRPVIAYKKGGLLDTVIENETGIFFAEQTSESLEDAILRFQEMQFDPDACVKNADRFKKEKFIHELKRYITYVYNENSDRT